jgi:hypothetical protein
MSGKPGPDFNRGTPILNARRLLTRVIASLDHPLFASGGKRVKKLKIWIIKKQPSFRAAKRGSRTKCCGVSNRLYFGPLVNILNSFG